MDLTSLLAGEGRVMGLQRLLFTVTFNAIHA